MALSTADAIGLLAATLGERRTLDAKLSAFAADSTPVHLYALGVSTVAPSPAVAKALHAAASSVGHLDTVAIEAKALTDSLASLSTQAEAAVRRVRELDGLRSRIQSALERTEDILDLRSCLSGVTAAMEAGDMESAALHIKRFKAVQGQLPIPDGDVATMQEAEARVMAVVTAQLDESISRAAAVNAQQQQHQRLLHEAASSEGSAAVIPASAGANGSTAAAAQAVAGTIARCCQLMNILGHADTGLTRYVSYLSDTLRSECADALRAVVAASGGIDERAVAVNVLSTLLGRAASALENASGLAESLFSGEEAPAAILAAVHSVTDRSACKLVTSFARSGRLGAMLVARETIAGRFSADSDSAGGRNSSGGAGSRGGKSDGSIYESDSGVGELGAASAGRMLAALEDDAVDAPFGLPRGSPPVTSPIYRGVDYSQPGVYDALLDEAAILLQRCSSYFRLVFGRAAALDAARASAAAVASGVDGPAAGKGGAGRARLGLSPTAAAAAAAAAGVAPPSALPAETRVRSAGSRMREAAGELGGLLSLAEEAGLIHGIGKAISIDELVPDGAAGASVDILSIGTANDTSLLLAAAAGGGAGGAVSPSASSGDGVVSADAGAGAPLTTLVEDCFYVCQKTLHRAFATGDANVACTVVNHVVTLLSDRLGAELEARLRVAFEEGGPGGSSSSGGSGGAGASGSQGGALAVSGGFPLSASLLASPAFLERLRALRAALGSSPLLQGAQAKLARYQSLSRSSGSGGRPGGAGDGSGAHGGGDDLSSSGGGTGAGSGMGSPGPKGSSSGGVTADAGGAPRRDTAAPTAKLTDELLASALALNCLQLAAECASRLARQAEELASDVFGGGASSGGASSELEKVRTCVSGISDLASALRRVQDAGITTLVARLTPRLRSALNVFEGTSSLIQYELTEDGFAAAAEGGLNAFSSEFLPVLASILAPFQFSLTPLLAGAVVTKVGTYVSRQLEPRLKRKRFSQLGGIQFDADMRALVSFFALRSSRRIRERFARLTAMAQLLSLESPAEVAEYVGGGGGGGGGGAAPRGRPGAASGTGGVGVGSGGAWELSSDEVRGVLALRSDWAPADIARLKL